MIFLNRSPSQGMGEFFWPTIARYPFRVRLSLQPGRYYFPVHPMKALARCD